jgi:hypothetical protein
LEERDNFKSLSELVLPLSWNTSCVLLSSQLLLCSEKEDLMKFTSFEGLKKIVSDRGGLAIVEMWQLRDALGVSRLGPIVTKSIGNELAQQGLGHQPSTLPLDQYASVRIFRKGSSFAELVDLFESFDEESNRRLIDLTMNDSTETLRKIRELVCV